MKQVMIGRYNAVGPISRETWKELISSLALSGYEVCADEDEIVFILSNEDECKEVKKNDNKTN